jgi:alanine dehydrogenase
VAGDKRGRERAGETILFWHRGLSITDVALGEALLAKARAQRLGRQLPYRG